MITGFLGNGCDADYIHHDYQPWSNSELSIPTRPSKETDLHPRLVIGVFSNLRKEVIILELTVCCELFYTSAQKRKTQGKWS